MRPRIFLLFILLVLLSLSCNLSGLSSQAIPATSAPVDPGTLSTMVAGTLTASVPQAEPTDALSMAATSTSALATAVMSTAEADAASAAATLTAMAGGAPQAALGGSPEVTQPAPQAAPGPLPYVAPPAAFDTGLLRIVYYDGAGLQLWSEGGARQLLYSGEPVSNIAISDDGWVTAFTTRNEYYIETGLWRVYADGSGLQKLLDATALKAFSQDANADSASPYQMQFVPASHTLAFNTRMIFMGPGLSVQDDLRLLEMDSAQLRTLFEPGAGGVFSFSPDGSRVALVTPTGVSLAKSDGSERKANLVTFPGISTYSEYQFYPNVRWAADGSRLLAAIPSQDPLAANPTMTVWQIDAASGQPGQVGTFPFDLSLFFAQNVIAPDLTSIAYLKRIGAAENNNWELHVARLDGSQDNTLRSGIVRFVAWSPDSKWVTVEDGSELLNGNLSNGNFSPLADHLPATGAAWVDGGRFLYWNGAGQSWSLRLGGFIAASQEVGQSTVDVNSFAFTTGIK